MASAEAAGGGLKACLLDITRADTSGDYDKALKAANRVLRKFPKEQIAFKCKLIALIQLGQLDDALAFIKKTPSSQLGECHFEMAYIYYRRNENELAFAALEKCASNDYRALELKAQLAFRTEQFQLAHDIFKQLLKNHSDDLDDLRNANLLAVQAQLQTQGVTQSAETSFDTWEQLYNSSCQDIEADRFDVALQKLEKAQKLAQKTLADDGSSEQDIEEETAVIRVQRAFILQRLGRTDEALKLYNEVQSIEPADVSVLATIINNIPSASPNFNIVEARKKLKSAMQMDQSKLTNRQKRTLLLNQALVLLVSNQREPCRRVLEDIRANFGKVREANLIEASLLSKIGDVDKALTLLSDQKGTDASLTTLHILANNKALDIVQGLPEDVRREPGILSFEVSLAALLGKHDDAVRRVEDSLKKSSGVKLKKYLLDKAASLETGRGNLRAAVVHLEKLAELDKENTSVQCRLIQAYSVLNPKKAEELSEKLLHTSGEKNINVDELETSDYILYGEKYRQKKDQKTEPQDTEIVTGKLRNRKRKRKVRLPKNYDPNVPPDPERWLPRQERTAYKKRMGKRHKEREVGRGTQGAVASPNATVSSIEVENSPKPTPLPGEGPRQQRPPGQQPKKKKPKKGGKW